MKNNSKVRKMVLTALMAALVLAFAKLEIPVPGIMDVNRFHLGNTMCALSGILLGPWWGGLASGLGSALYDLLDPLYITDLPTTFINKGLYGVVSGLVYVKCFRRRSNYLSEVLSALSGAVTYIILYLAKKFFLDSMFVAGMDTTAAWVIVVSKLPSSAFNGIVAVVFAPILAVAVRQALKKSKMEYVLE